MSSLVEEKLGLGVTIGEKAELRPNWTEDDLQRVFRSTYEHIFGRERFYQTEAFASAEAFLRNGSINVRQFVAQLAKSDFYKEKFFQSNSQIRFIELNYKHFLGRAPYDQSEIAYHVDIYASAGYDEEIDSYIYSSEYDQAFGDNTVPYYRGFQSILGMKTVGFNRLFALYRGNGNSDNAQTNKGKSALGRRIAGNLSNSVTSALTPVGLKASPATTGDNRVYLVEVTTGLSSTQVAVRRSRQVYKVPFESLSDRYQEIHKRGGKIVSITPL